MLGDQTGRVSTHAELLTGANTAGSGAPAHTPQVAKQTYVDIDTGDIHEWYDGEWIAP